MALTLIYQSKKAMIDSLELDASVSEEHVAESDVTEHPVETGADVTDHVRQKPDRLSIEGVVSDSPVKFLGAFDQSRSADAYEQLRQLKESATLVTVATTLRTYESMVIKALRIPRDAGTGRALRFRAELQRVRTVTGETVQLAPKRSSAKSRVGKKTGAAASKAAEQKTSFLYDLKQWTKEKWSAKP